MAAPTNTERSTYGLSRWKVAYWADPEKHRAKNRAYYAENREAQQQRSASYKEAHLESVAATQKAYRQKHPEFIRQLFRDWCKKYPERVWLRSKATYARRKGALGRCSFEQLEARIAFYGWKCAYCKVAPYEHLDHVIPLARGGTNFPANIRPSCKRCNMSKGAKLLSEWKREA